MSSSTPSDFTFVKSTIQSRHIQQLQEIAGTEELILYPDPVDEVPTGPFPIFATYDDIIQWTKDSMATINKAKTNRVYGGSKTAPMDFNNSFMAFMESAAVYLRDTSKVIQAVQVLSEGGPNSLEEAKQLLIQSTAQIERVANMWGMDFVVICDLVTKHPDGHSFMVGPFCGAFVTRDIRGKSPFVGIAFKGTSVTMEVINDLLAMVTTKGGQWLWNQSISQGFFYPLFSTYDRKRTKLPFTTIQDSVRDIMSQASSRVVAHVTGHSLGGAYATLTYAQLCISGFGGRTTAPIDLGDLYTFGAPRAGRNDFAKALRDAMRFSRSTIGTTWRVANKGDYVPEVPVTLIPWWWNPFVHIDSGWKVYKDKQPTRLKSEINTNPWPAVLTGLSPHYTTEYYKSLKYATTGRPPRALTAIETQRTAAALTVFPNTADLYSLTYDPAQLVPQNNPNISLETYDDFVEGTIKVGHFVGEITALGSFHGVLDKGSGFSCGSWLKLLSKQNQCVFKKEAEGVLGIYFLIDEEVIGHATLSGENEEADVSAIEITRGSCTWTLNADDPEVEKLSNAFAASFAGIFPDSQVNRLVDESVAA